MVEQNTLISFDGLSWPLYDFAPPFHLKLWGTKNWKVVTHLLLNGQTNALENWTWSASDHLWSVSRWSTKSIHAFNALHSKYIIAVQTWFVDSVSSLVFVWFILLDLLYLFVVLDCSGITGLLLMCSSFFRVLPGCSILTESFIVFLAVWKLSVFLERIVVCLGFGHCYFLQLSVGFLYSCTVVFIIVSSLWKPNYLKPGVQSHKKKSYYLFSILMYLFLSIPIYSFLFLSILIYSYLFLPILIYSYLFLSILIYSYLFLPILIYFYLFLSCIIVFSRFPISNIKVSYLFAWSRANCTTFHEMLWLSRTSKIC